MTTNAMLTMKGTPIGVWPTPQEAKDGVDAVWKTGQEIVDGGPPVAKGRWQMGDIMAVQAGYAEPGKDWAAAMTADDIMTLTVTVKGEGSEKELREIRAHVSGRLAEAAYESGAKTGSSKIEGEMEIGGKVVP